MGILVLSTVIAASGFIMPLHSFPLRKPWTFLLRCIVFRPFSRDALEAFGV